MSTNRCISFPVLLTALTVETTNKASTKARKGLLLRKIPPSFAQVSPRLHLACLKKGGKYEMRVFNGAPTVFLEPREGEKWPRL